VPDWLTEIVRIRHSPVPWAAMLRAVIAICVPLAVAMTMGVRGPGVLVATGGLMGTIVDPGGPYAARVKQVGSALSGTLDAIADDVEGGADRSGVPRLPSDEPLKPVTEAVHSVLTVLATGSPAAPATTRSG
jgi:hypothetical protein